MTISVSISRTPASMRKMSYPKLVVFHQTGSIVYMSNAHNGTVLQRGYQSPHQNGKQINFISGITNRTDWNDFRGTVELKNENNERD